MIYNNVSKDDVGVQAKYINIATEEKFLDKFIVQCGKTVAEFDHCIDNLNSIYTRITPEKTLTEEGKVLSTQPPTGYVERLDSLSKGLYLRLHKLQQVTGKLQEHL